MVNLKQNSGLDTPNYINWKQITSLLDKHMQLINVHNLKKLTNAAVGSFKINNDL